MKNKVLIMYTGYKPAKTYGGIVNSISNIIEACGTEKDFFVIASNHELNDDRPIEGIKTGWNKVDLAEVLYLSNEELNVKNIYKQIEKIKPDVIYLQSLFLYKYLFASIKYANKYNVKIVLAPRGELCKNAFALKKLKKQIYVKALKILGINKKMIYHSTSDEETNCVSKILNVKKEFIKQVSVIPTKTNIETNKKIKEKDKLKCVFISRITAKKNLLKAIEYVNAAKTGVELDIYGFIEDKEYWQKCSNEMQKCKKVKYCGSLEPKEVVNKFKEYDLFLFPTLSENYGHVIAESMIAGCPVLISDQTPWNDVKNYNGGFVVQVNNDNEFVNVLNQLVHMDNETYTLIKQGCTKYIKQKIDYEGITKQYLGLLDKEKKNESIAN